MFLRKVAIETSMKESRNIAVAVGSKICTQHIAIIDSSQISLNIFPKQ